MSKKRGKDEDMKDEKEVSDSEESSGKKEGAGKWRDGPASPARPPVIDHLTPVQKSRSERTSDTSRSHYNRKSSFNREEDEYKVPVAEAGPAHFRKPLASAGNETLLQ